MRKTRKEIIDETASFYNLSSLARGEGVCHYLTNDGRMCAVGRCLENPAEVEACNASIDNIIDKCIFKPEYNGHSIEFWIDIQCLHDTLWYWTVSGISESGLEKVAALHDRWDEKETP